MASNSPLHTLHEQAEASFLYYGAAEGGAQVVETFGELEAEYAAIRKGCVLMDHPQRSTLVATGEDALPFLNRMITQELADLKPFQARPSFWLNRKGRIDADLRVVRLPERIMLDVDVLAAARTVETLDAFIIADDVQLVDRSDELHRLSLHGPTAAALLAAVSRPQDGPPPADLGEGQATLIGVGEHEVVVERWDAAGDPGLWLTVPVDGVREVYFRLLETGLPNGPREGGAEEHPYRLRQAGWHAFNIARIEAGEPIYNLDFGPDNLPGETGVMRSRVSFTKGCYLGQEVVARMDALGKPKQQLVGVRIEADEDQAQPVTGARVFPPPGEGDGDLAGATASSSVGAVTSSTRSPMLSNAIVCFAQVKTAHAAPGSALVVETDAGLRRGVVREGLRFWAR